MAIVASNITQMQKRLLTSCEKSCGSLPAVRLVQTVSKTIESPLVYPCTPAGRFYTL